MACLVSPVAVGGGNHNQLMCHDQEDISATIKLRNLGEI